MTAAFSRVGEGFFFSFFLLSFPFNVFISRYRWADEKRTGLVKTSVPTTFRFFLFPSQ